MCPSKSPNNTEYHITYMVCKSSYHILFCRIDRYSPNMINQHWDERKIARGQLDLAQMPNPEARLIQLLPPTPHIWSFLLPSILLYYLVPGHFENSRQKLQPFRLHCISQWRNSQLVRLCGFLRFFAPLAPIIQLSYGHENLHCAVSLDNPDV